MTNEELIQLAASAINSKQIDDFTSGDVGCALISENDNIYTGVCIDTMSSMGFCAEHNAIGSMITAKEYGIKKIVAVWKDKNGDLFILHPCGRCREFMRQLHKENMDITEVIIGKDKVVKLGELLPYNEDWSKV